MAFGLVGVMLYAAGFPIFFLLFVGSLTYFIWKIFSAESRHDVRRIFEFYLSANEILREDQRRWYGYEIQETINRGEKIVRSMSYSPPLVHFALGSLYQRLGDHSSAVKHLSYIADGAGSEEGIVFPSNEFREYVRILRKIERSPAEAPQTSSALRSLERARKNKTNILLEECRALVIKEQNADEPTQRTLESVVDRPHKETLGSVAQEVEPRENVRSLSNSRIGPSSVNQGSSNGEPVSTDKERSADRQTISEVLHDIYDKSVQ